MPGYNLILKIRKLEEECNELGFMMCNSKYGDYKGYGETVAIKPKDPDSLPMFSRDAEFFCGTIEELEVWLKGLNWARDYDRMLFGKPLVEKRERKEQDYRNKLLASLLKQTDDK